MQHQNFCWDQYQCMYYQHLQNESSSTCDSEMQQICECTFWKIIETIIMTCWLCIIYLCPRIDITINIQDRQDIEVYVVQKLSHNGFFSISPNSLHTNHRHGEDKSKWLTLCHFHLLDYQIIVHVFGTGIGIWRKIWREIRTAAWIKSTHSNFSCLPISLVILRMPIAKWI